MVLFIRIKVYYGSFKDDFTVGRREGYPNIVTKNDLEGGDTYK